MHGRYLPIALMLPLLENAEDCQKGESKANKVVPGQFFFQHKDHKARAVS
jgi:hypothetical protein